MFAGYSLVGVYPCAVWKPSADGSYVPQEVLPPPTATTTLPQNCAACSLPPGCHQHETATLVAGSQSPIVGGPVRVPRLASSYRRLPYPQVQFYSSPTIGGAGTTGAITAAAAAVGNPTVSSSVSFLDQCRCRNIDGFLQNPVAASSSTAAATSSSAAPMLFLPLPLQSTYGGSPLTGATTANGQTPLTNGTVPSPSNGYSTPMMKVSCILLFFFLLDRRLSVMRFPRLLLPFNVWRMQHILS